MQLQLDGLAELHDHQASNGVPNVDAKEAQDITTTSTAEDGDEIKKKHHHHRHRHHHHKRQEEENEDGRSYIDDNVLLHPWVSLFPYLARLVVSIKYKNTTGTQEASIKSHLLSSAVCHMMASFSIAKTLWISIVTYQAFWAWTKIIC